MISHLVLFRFKPEISRQDPRVAAVVADMADLPAKIASITVWEHGFNKTEDADAWDYALRASFSSQADLHAYFEHPAHLPVLEQWNALADLAFVDF
ncbi:MAG: Dabb family protein [Rhodocyclaceae bacterium]|nr:Dabb family protein [Rhodocyclaceae bacterium]